MVSPKDMDPTSRIISPIESHVHPRYGRVIHNIDCCSHKALITTMRLYEVVIRLPIWYLSTWKCPPLLEGTRGEAGDHDSDHSPQKAPIPLPEGRRLLGVFWEDYGSYPRLNSKWLNPCHIIENLLVLTSRSSSFSSRLPTTSPDLLQPWTLKRHTCTNRPGLSPKS